jgi:macrolide-specific efflux system membrane fusion protein
MKIKKMGIIIVILILIIAAGVFLKAKSSSVVDKEEIIRPIRGGIQTLITTTATVYPKNRLEIKPPVNGRVEEVLVSEGDMVKSGKILAWMSSTDRAALLDSARGQGEKAFKYWQDVYKPIPLLAPINGQVIVATTQPGQTVTTTDDVVVLSDHLIVRAQVDETDIGRIKLNQDAVVSLDAYPDTKIKARVEHIYYESTTVNNVTIYNVDLLAREVPSFFRSGMNANVDFIIEKKDNILLLPGSAITKRDGKSFVLLKSANQLKSVMQEIQTGISDDKNVEILSGLSEGDSVVIKVKEFSLNKLKVGGSPFMPSRPANSKAGTGGPPPG